MTDDAMVARLPPGLLRPALPSRYRFSRIEAITPVAIATRT
jgi:hypothetical protein